MSVVIVALISSLLVSFLPQTQAYGPLNYACCVKYTRNPLPFGLIKGYIEQSSREVCRIDAIIFFTKHNKKVCASVKDEWVRAALARLSTKINKITHPRSQHHLTTARMDSMPYTNSP
ncbi:C-C motif chemokine 20 [Triplophysa rosa]|uniref:C-C motif chemokine 20-like n=1 Tax=Triplophysa rosa TaxID=992332 RepID=A0A9W8C854_TRIRA|nr:C-C motif chemokine 20 [Triplophysa rosa]KAI7809924.1 putative C-C motif chemokine 20-like [Triplophysa rosa]